MRHPIDIFVGMKVRQRRRHLKVSQQELAGSVGIKFQQIQKYETGTNRISASKLWDISKQRDTTVSYFFEGAEDLPQENTGN